MVSFSSVLSTCRQAASQFVNPIAPSIVREGWFRVQSMDPLTAVWPIANQVLKVAPYPSYVIKGPLWGLVVCAKFGFLGTLAAKNLNRFLQGANLALIGTDIYNGERVVGATRLITWAYLQTPQKNIPEKVDLVARSIIAIAVCVSSAAFLYNRPKLALMIAAITTIATSISFYKGVNPIKQAIQYYENKGCDRPHWVPICRDLRENLSLTLVQMARRKYVYPAPPSVEDQNAS